MTDCDGNVGGQGVSSRGGEARHYENLARARQAKFGVRQNKGQGKESRRAIRDLRRA